MTDKRVISKLDELLSPLGFARRKSTWNRRVGLVVDVIDVQVSKAGDAITVNCGVLDRDVHATLWGEDPPEFLEEPFCTARARVGELIGSVDKWWSLEKESAPIDVAQVVEGYVLPFLKRTHPRQAMEAWLEKAQVVKKKFPDSILCLAILKKELGRKEEACALMSSVRPKILGAWRTRFDEVSVRLGCR
jgi:Domain of unknown function (DUF4304)